MSYTLFAILSLILVTTLSLKHDRQMFGITMAVGVLAIICFVFAGHNYLGADDDEFFARRIILDREVGIAAEKFGLFELDQAIEANFLRPVLG